MIRALLVVSSSSIWGAERHVAELATGLAAVGVEVEVACPAGGGLPHLLVARGVALRTYPGDAPRPRVAKQMAKWARDFDVVHTHLTEATLLAAPFRVATGRPLVETRHFLELAHESRPWPSRSVGRLLRRSL